MMEGHYDPRFFKVARMFERQLGLSPDDGAALCVYHQGRCVVDLWGGRRDSEGRPWRSDTMAVSFSTTKGVASTALHILVDRGRLDYDDRVARYWPEFAVNGKEHITIRQVLCHEAGLFRIRDMIDNAERMWDWEHMVRALALAAPAIPPGTANAYHGLTYGWLVGELIRRISGETITDFVAREIAMPLGLDGLFIGVPAQEHHRVAELRIPPHRMRFFESRDVRFQRVQRYLAALRTPVDIYRTTDALVPHGMTDFDWNSPRTLKAAIPAANGVFTARSLARMYAALANGGELDGVRLISERTIRRAAVVQNRRKDLVVVFPMHWRLGYHRAPAGRNSLGRAFGHFGFGGSGAFADPDRNLSLGYTVNSGFGSPFGDLRVWRLAVKAQRCARRISARLSSKRSADTML